MKNKGNLLYAGIMSAVIIFGVSIYNGLAANNTPGSANDPLVTKSYVDDKFNQISVMLGMLNTSGSQAAQPTMQPETVTGDTAAIVQQVMAQLEYIYNIEAGVQADAEAKTVYKPVFAFAGQFVVGNEGAEMILRSGKATGYCPGENGLVNMTTGSEIYDGNEISINHLVIVSRGDGRGMRATTDAWFLIRGGYSIYN